MHNDDILSRMRFYNRGFQYGFVIGLFIGITLTVIVVFVFGLFL